MEHSVSNHELHPWMKKAKGLFKKRGTYKKIHRGKYKVTSKQNGETMGSLNP
jgi:predicted transcriptional regulator of viral defense system